MRRKRIKAREVPFPRICPDCFHDECLAAFDAWQLLTKLEAEDVAAAAEARGRR